MISSMYTLLSKPTGTAYTCKSFALHHPDPLLSPSYTKRTLWAWTTKQASICLAQQASWLPWELGGKELTLGLSRAKLKELEGGSLLFTFGPQANSASTSQQQDSTAPTPSHPAAAATTQSTLTTPPTFNTTAHSSQSISNTSTIAHSSSPNAKPITSGDGTTSSTATPGAAASPPTDPSAPSSKSSWAQALARISAFIKEETQQPRGKLQLLLGAAVLFAAAAAVVNATLVGGLADSVQAGSNASSELAQYVQLDTMGGLKAYSPPQATSAAAGTGVGAGVGALLQAIGGAGAGLKEFLLGHLSWIFQRWTYSNLLVKILMVIASSMPLVLMFGTMYHAVGGTSKLNEALLKMHLIINRMPGPVMVAEANLFAFAVVNAAFLTGLFTFAVFLGIVTDEVKLTFRQIKNGMFPVRVNEHVLMLNWNQHSIPMLRQYAAARTQGVDPFFNRPVVVLSEEPKHVMDNSIAERLTAAGFELDVRTRCGNPTVLKDLETVAAHKAHTVIVMHPQGSSDLYAAEAAKASAAMALATVGAPERQHVVFHMPHNMAEQDADPVLSFARAELGSRHSHARGHLTAARVKVLSLSDSCFMDRLSCQAALQPGLLRVWAGLLQYSGHSASIRLLPLPQQLEGRTLCDASRLYGRCAVVGVVRGGGEMMEKVQGLVLQRGDQLILVTDQANPQPSSSPAPVYTHAIKAASERLQRGTGYHAPARQVLLAGYRAADVQDAATAFAEFAPDGTRLTFILPDAHEELPSSVGGVRLRYVHSNHYLSLRALQDANISRADSIMLHPPRAAKAAGGSASEAQYREADALVMAGLMQVQDAVAASGRSDAPHVVARVNRYNTLLTANAYFQKLNTQQAEVLGRVGANTARSSSSSSAGKVKNNNQSSSTESGSSSSSTIAAVAAAPAGSAAAGVPSAIAEDAPCVSSSSSSGSVGSGGGLSSSAKRRPLMRMPEVLLADDMASAILTQVAAQPDFAQVITHLFEQQGVELYLRSPRVLHIQEGESVTYAEVVELCRATDQTALGVIKSDGRALLVPPADQVISFQDGDQVIMLSEDYRVQVQRKQL